MPVPMSDTVFHSLQEIITELINCSEDEVVLDARLKEDLGFESIDFLELGLILSQQHGVDVDDEALFLSDFPALIRRGSKEDVLTRLSEAYPHLPPEELQRIAGRPAGEDVLTVGHLVHYVAHHAGVAGAPLRTAGGF